MSAEADVGRFYGSQHERQVIKAIGRNYLVPEVSKSGKLIGELVDVDIRYVVSDFHYSRRQDILNLLDKSFFTFAVGLRNTNYLRRSGGFFFNLWRAFDYRRLYASVAKRGLVFDPADVFSTPWLFVSATCFCRLDGHHRASVARHLGYKRIMTRVITARDILSLPGIPEEYSKFLSELEDPTVDLGCCPV